MYTTRANLFNVHKNITVTAKLQKVKECDSTNSMLLANLLSGLKNLSSGIAAFLVRVPRIKTNWSIRGAFH